MYTSLTYRYRDALNNQEEHTVYFTGRGQGFLMHLIAEKLDNYAQFIPAQVGLDSLQGRSGEPIDDELDHVWHEIDVNTDIRTVASLPPGVAHLGSVMLIGERFKAVRSWDIDAEANRLGFI